MIYLAYAVALLFSFLDAISKYGDGVPGLFRHLFGKGDGVRLGLFAFDLIIRATFYCYVARLIWMDHWGAR